jgi:hypothetical protein
MQSFGSPSKVQFFSNGDEVPEVAQFYVVIHIQDILILTNNILDVG